MGINQRALRTVYFWINKFKCIRTCTEDEPLSERTIMVTMKKNNWKNPWHRNERSSSTFARNCWGCEHLNWTSTSYMKIWIRKSCLHDGCRDCWLSTKNILERIFQCSVWRCLIAIRRTFCVDSWLWTKFGSITTHWNSKQQSKQWTGDRVPKKAKSVLSGKLRKFGKWWSLFFGIPKESSWLTTWKRARQSPKHIMRHYWTFERRIEGKTRLARKKVFFHQDNASFHTGRRYGKIAWIDFVLVSYQFLEFGTVWLLPVPKLKIYFDKKKFILIRRNFY